MSHRHNLDYFLDATPNCCHCITAEETSYGWNLWKRHCLFQVSPIFFLSNFNVYQILKAREEGITSQRIYQYWIFHHIVIKTCFEMHAKILRTREIMTLLKYRSPILKIVLKLDQLIPQFNFEVNFKF